MTFGDALDAMEKGARTRRPDWTGRVFVERVTGVYAFDLGGGVLVDGNSVPPVTLTLEDLAADDWEIV